MNSISSSSKPTVGKLSANALTSARNPSNSGSTPGPTAHISRNPLSFFPPSVPLRRTAISTARSKKLATWTKSSRRDLATAADVASERAIVARLREAYPDHAIEAEEEVCDQGDARKGPRWFVDPLDGTKEFIKKNGEFTVNIALVEKGRPVLGVVYRPVNDILYLGVENAGAWRIEGGGHPRVLEGGPHYSEKDQEREYNNILYMLVNQILFMSLLLNNMVLFLEAYFLCFYIYYFFTDR